MQNNQPPSHQESPFKGKTGVRRLINAFGYSMDGFKAAYQHEDAFRQEVWLSLVLIPLAFYLEAEALHRILMVGSVLLVMIVELLNSAVEAVVDRVSIERHALAKRAKDIGSAAVLLALINLAVVWGLILLG
ncbi:diacylglycerol kinase [Methylophilus sp. 5]|uniref:diacylglycerol kinase n=1 Tax=Methylophilus sp. 5 TaxID=1112274 RepID=UPI00048B578F|nr:diacylglycerol kinase [Methylophilus sp. 5]